MSINKITVGCQAGMDAPMRDIPPGSILLSIVDGRDSHCDIKYNRQGYAAVIDLRITRAQDVSAVAMDLLSSFDFASTEHVLVVRSCSRHVDGMEVAYLLSALFPDAPIADESGRLISGFVVKASPVYAEVAYG